MLKFKKFTTPLLLIIFSIHNFIIGLSPKDVVIVVANEKYIDTSVTTETSNISEAKDQYYLPPSMSLALSADDISREINNAYEMSAIPEIHNVDMKELSQKKFSEKQQKKSLKSLDKLRRKEIIREQDIIHPETMKERELNKQVFDSDIVLKNISLQDDIDPILNHPLVQARFDRLENFFKYRRKKVWRESKTRRCNQIIRMIQALKSGRVKELIDRIRYSDLMDAKKALLELKTIFSVDKIPVYADSDIVKLLGIDVLGMGSADLFLRADYIKSELGEGYLNEIEQFSELCSTLQRENNVAALENIYMRLDNKVKSNIIRNKIDDICFIIAERSFQDPINITLGQIRYGSPDQAIKALHDLEEQMVPKEPTTHIMLDDEYMRKSIMSRSTFNRVAAAQKIQKNRSDYALFPNTESKASGEPGAIAASINLSDISENSATHPQSFEQKLEENVFKENIEPQYLEKTFEKEFFVPMDVQNITADILDHSKDYHAVADGLRDVARQVLGNAYLCNLENVAGIQESIDQSLDIIRAPKSDVEFVYHVATVDHVLTDLQTQSEIVAEGKPTLWERTPGLLARGLTTFVLRVNPIEQAKDWGSLGVMGIKLLGKGIWALGDAALHPLTTAEKIYCGTERACEFVVNVARFTSDSVSEAYHLIPEERAQRMDEYWQNAQAIYAAIEPHLTAENFVDATATIAADIVAGKGFSCLYRYAKDVQLLSKAYKHTKNIAKVLKRGIDTHLADNPVVVTAEGIVFKMSEGVKDLNKSSSEVINSTKTLLKSSNAPIAESLKAEAGLFQKIELQKKSIEFGKARMGAEQLGLPASKKLPLLPAPTATRAIPQASGKIKSFPTVNDKLKDHIFSDNHKKDGIMNLGKTEEAICDRFVEIIKQADAKNLLKEGPNNIVTKIDGYEVTIRAFIKDDHVINYNGFINLSKRKVDNLIYL